MNLFARDIHLKFLFEDNDYILWQKEKKSLEEKKKIIKGFDNYNFDKLLAFYNVFENLNEKKELCEIDFKYNYNQFFFIKFFDLETEIFRDYKISSKKYLFEEILNLQKNSYSILSCDENNLIKTYIKYPIGKIFIKKSFFSGYIFEKNDFILNLDSYKFLFERTDILNKYYIKGIEKCFKSKIPENFIGYNYLIDDKSNVYGKLLNYIKDIKLLDKINECRELKKYIKDKDTKEFIEYDFSNNNFDKKNTSSSFDKYIIDPNTGKFIKYKLENILNMKHNEKYDTKERYIRDLNTGNLIKYEPYKKFIRDLILKCLSEGKLPETYLKDLITGKFIEEKYLINDDTGRLIFTNLLKEEYNVSEVKFIKNNIFINKFPNYFFYDKTSKSNLNKKKKRIKFVNAYKPVNIDYKFINLDKFNNSDNEFIKLTKENNKISDLHKFIQIYREVVNLDKLYEIYYVFKLCASIVNSNEPISLNKFIEFYKDVVIDSDKLVEMYQNLINSDELDKMYQNFVKLELINTNEFNQYYVFINKHENYKFIKNKFIEKNSIFFNLDEGFRENKEFIDKEKIYEFIRDKFIEESVEFLSLISISNLNNKFIQKNSEFLNIDEIDKQDNEFIDKKDNQLIKEHDERLDLLANKVNKENNEFIKLGIPINKINEEKNNESVKNMVLPEDIKLFKEINDKDHKFSYKDIKKENVKHQSIKELDHFDKITSYNDVAGSRHNISKDFVNNYYGEPKLENEFDKKDPIEVLEEEVKKELLEKEKFIKYDYPGIFKLGKSLEYDFLVQTIVDINVLYDLSSFSFLDRVFLKNLTNLMLRNKKEKISTARLALDFNRILFFNYPNYDFDDSEYFKITKLYGLDDNKFRSLMIYYSIGLHVNPEEDDYPELEYSKRDVYNYLISSNNYKTINTFNEYNVVRIKIFKDDDKDINFSLTEKVLEIMRNNEDLSDIYDFLIEEDATFHVRFGTIDFPFDNDDSLKEYFALNTYNDVIGPIYKNGKFHLVKVLDFKSKVFKEENIQIKVKHFFIERNLFDENLDKNLERESSIFQLKKALFLLSENRNITFMKKNYFIEFLNQDNSDPIIFNSIKNLKKNDITPILELDDG